MSRYVLPDEAAMQLLGGFSILQDFPEDIGEVRSRVVWCGVVRGVWWGVTFSPLHVAT
jgi:hypothetical protein